MDAAQQVIELYNRGETEAANIVIDSDETLTRLMKERQLDHNGLIDYLIATNSNK